MIPLLLAKVRVGQNIWLGLVTAKFPTLPPGTKGLLPLGSAKETCIPPLLFMAQPLQKGVRVGTLRLQALVKDTVVRCCVILRPPPGRTLPVLLRLTPIITLAPGRRSVPDRVL